MKWPPSNARVWFAVLGGAAAWAVQFVVNLMLTFARCNAPAGRFNLPVHGLEIGLSVVAFAIGLTALLTSGWLFLVTNEIDHVAQAEMRGLGNTPPTGRINFLAMVGLTVNFLALAIIVMTAIGAPLLPVCQQS